MTTVVIKMAEYEATMSRVKTHDGMKGFWVTDGKNTPIRSDYNPNKDVKGGNEEEGTLILNTVLKITEKA